MLAALVALDAADERLGLLTYRIDDGRARGGDASTRSVPGRGIGTALYVSGGGPGAERRGRPRLVAGHDERQLGRDRVLPASRAADRRRSPRGGRRGEGSQSRRSRFVGENGIELHDEIELELEFRRAIATVPERVYSHRAYW